MDYIAARNLRLTTGAMPLSNAFNAFQQIKLARDDYRRRITRRRLAIFARQESD